MTWTEMVFNCVIIICAVAFYNITVKAVVSRHRIDKYLQSEKKKAKT